MSISVEIVREQKPKSISKIHQAEITFNKLYKLEKIIYTILSSKKEKVGFWTIHILTLSGSIVTLIAWKKGIELHIWRLEWVNKLFRTQQ